MSKPVSKANSSTETAPSTCARGSLAEERVAAYLGERGFSVLERNFRWRGGEIDLVALDSRGVLVFVEVRSSALGRSAWLRFSIGPAKRRRLLRTAQLYEQARRQYGGRARRFDFIWVEGELIEHWKNVII